MGARPFGVVIEGEPGGFDLPSGWRATTVDDLPSDPFDLSDRRLVVLATVAVGGDAEDVLMAAARGCAVVVGLRMVPPVADQFLDDLGRLVDFLPIARLEALDDDQVALLERLADGDTVTEAARHLGWSRRTATRRLGDAKRRLGVSSTGEAVQALRASS
jgi:DNA-binding NarL/FixJ family response regulator